MYSDQEKIEFKLFRAPRSGQDRIDLLGRCSVSGLSALAKLPAIAGRTTLSEAISLRKEVIQPQVLLRLPCYDFTPIMNYTLGGCSLAVSAPTSSATHFRDVTGGVYKARERIHRGMLIHDY
jgi:hypothetical protein